MTGQFCHRDCSCRRDFLCDEIEIDDVRCCFDPQGGTRAVNMDVRTRGRVTKRENSAREREKEKLKERYLSHMSGAEGVGAPTWAVLMSP